MQETTEMGPLKLDTIEDRIRYLVSVLEKYRKKLEDDTSDEDNEKGDKYRSSLDGGSSIEDYMDSNDILHGEYLGESDSM